MRYLRLTYLLFIPCINDSVVEGIYSDSTVTTRLNTMRGSFRAFTFSYVRHLSVVVSTV